MCHQLRILQFIGMSRVCTPLSAYNTMYSSENERNVIGQPIKTRSSLKSLTKVL